MESGAPPRRGRSTRGVQTAVPPTGVEPAPVAILSRLPLPVGPRGPRHCSRGAPACRALSRSPGHRAKHPMAVSRRRARAARAADGPARPADDEVDGVGLDCAEPARGTTAVVGPSPLRRDPRVGRGEEGQRKHRQCTLARRPGDEIPAVGPRRHRHDVGGHQQWLPELAEQAHVVDPVAGGVVRGHVADRVAGGEPARGREPLSLPTRSPYACTASHATSATAWQVH
jgi:hypothetical protein